MLIERKEKKRKEKKSKGLFYLIFTLTIIAALTISCKNKPTGTNDFAGFDENVALKDGSDKITEENFKNFVNRTIHSRDSIDENGDGKADGYKWFWAKFDASGIQFDVLGTPSLEKAPNYRYNATLSANPLSDNTANFDAGKGPKGDDVKATIKFELENSKIKNIIVTFQAGTDFNNSAISCQFLE